eukprot:TRINITY_DN2381_c0_g1_i7.p1 TRINITY_DN2381_c0_g1~~TRINITY_DN2381_c0_g1_i7.p1  ORF type:complete len:186 (-),score=40.25 TRINITY_DN2381_c0_g1_i7:225-722(-)
MCIRDRSELDARRYFMQLIDGVDFLHKSFITHRDLKPENLLLDSQKNIKISGFSLSTSFEKDEILTEACGSPCYAAPEIFADQGYSGPSADVWSCGVILYAMICGKLPFEDENLPNMIQKIRTGSFGFTANFSEDAKSLVNNLLCVDAKTRYTIEDIRKHPWCNQ